METVSRELGERAVLRGENAGLHMLLELPELPANDAPELRRRCARRSVGLYPAAPYYAKPPAHAGFVLGYASLSPDQIREGISRLAGCMDDIALARSD